MDIERLIQEVERRPVLYDCRIAGYTRRELKPKLWLEVARAVTDEWLSLHPAQRNEKVMDVQKRWRTLRDNFKRELNYQRSVEAGEVAPTKRKKYVYYDQLSFLGPVMIAGSRFNEFTKMEMKELRAEEGGGEEMENGVGSEGAVVVDEECEASEMPLEELLQPRDEEDMFLLSLAPTLRRLDHQLRSATKLRILQVLHEAAYGGGGGGLAGGGGEACQHVIGPVVLHCHHGAAPSTEPPAQHP